MALTAKEVARSTDHIRVAGRAGGYNRGGLSADGSLLCLQHAELGDEMHEALRVIDPRTGGTVADLVDEGKQLASAAWSPIVGDRRLAVVHERGGIPQPAIWDPVTGEWTEIATGLDGEVSIADWWPDASALLLSQLHDGRYRLHRYEIATGALTGIEHPDGQVEWAQVRPDGAVWYRHSSGDSPPRILDDAGQEVVRLVGEPAPSSRPFELMRFENRHGQSVQGFLVTPTGSGPWPILVRPHGGPSWLDEDKWHPEVQSYVDAGFAVLLLNYRGSTGRGAEWRDTLVGDIGGPELEDLNDALDRLIADGIADPGARGGRWLVLGRLPHADDAGEAPRAGLAMRHRRCPGRGLRAVLRGPVAAPAGLRPRAAGRPPGRAPRADGRSEPGQLRRRRGGAGAVPHRRTRLALPVSAGDGLRGPARGPSSTRTRCTCSRRDTAPTTSRRRSASRGRSSGSSPSTSRG